VVRLSAFQAQAVSRWIAQGDRLEPIEYRAEKNGKVFL